MHRIELAQMSTMKEIMMKGMHAVMLDCEHATLFAVRAESEKLGCLKKLQLNMHLMGCKFCRAFVEQSKIISRQLNEMKTFQPGEEEVHLTEEQKNDLKAVIRKNGN